MLRYFGVVIAMLAGMLCIALALGRVAAETGSGKNSAAAPKKKAGIERARPKQSQKSTKKQAEPAKNDPRPQKRSLSQLSNRP